jgi:hypothetical protein
VSAPAPGGHPPNAASVLAARIASLREQPGSVPFSSLNVFGVITAPSAGEAASSATVDPSETATPSRIAMPVPIVPSLPVPPGFKPAQVDDAPVRA